MAEPAFSSEAVAARFKRLIGELLDEDTARNSFQPWEVDLLLDIERCCLPKSARKQVLRRYLKAVARDFERGRAMPRKLSEYLDQAKGKRRPEKAPDAILKA